MYVSFYLVDFCANAGEKTDSSANVIRWRWFEWKNTPELHCLSLAANSFITRAERYTINNIVVLMTMQLGGWIHQPFFQSTCVPFCLIFKSCHFSKRMSFNLFLFKCSFIIRSEWEGSASEIRLMRFKKHFSAEYQNIQKISFIDHCNCCYESVIFHLKQKSVHTTAKPKKKQNPRK